MIGIGKGVTSTQNIQIDNLKIDDVFLCRRLIDLSATQFGVEPIEMEKFDYTGRSKDNTFVLKLDGNIIGFLHYSLIHNKAVLKHIHIARKLRKFGYGTILLRHFRFHLKALNVNEIRVKVPKRFSLLHKFLEKNDFKLRYNLIKQKYYFRLL
ncbi:MAG: GNAT family N-acetyltransferase [Bdellovibrionales bacterium]